MNDRAATAHMDSVRASLSSFEKRKSIEETKALVSDLCFKFYTLGWFPGTGGSMTIKVHQDQVPRQNQIIVMTPSGVQKERIEPDDLYVVSSDGSTQLLPPDKPFSHFTPKCTDSACLFLKVYELCNAGAVIHSHALESCLATMIIPSSKEFRIKNMEMIKGIQGHGYHDELVVPIIENAPHESMLVDSLSEAIRAYPKSTAVLVRNHGVFIWGDTWISAKTQAECYHFLLAAAVKLHRLDC